MKNQRTKRARQSGFTLIEMIGVLAIIAVLVAAVAPQIFKTIDKSKVTNVLTMVKTLQGSSAAYYADLGTMLPIDVGSNTGAVIVTGDDGTGGDDAFSATLTHTKTAGQDNGKWPRFRGPYLEKFEIENPPIGTGMRLSALPVTAVGGAANNTSESNFSLNGAGTNDIGDGSVVLALVIDGVSSDQWKQIESGYEVADAMAGNEGTREVQGRVKYDGSTLVIYIAHN